MADAGRPDPIEVDIRRAGGVPIIDIRGEVTPTAEQALAGAFEEAIRSSPRGVVLNFEELQYMNSGGIGLLVTLLVRARREQVRLLACGLSDHYRRIFALTRLDEAISIHPDEQAALAAVG